MRLLHQVFHCFSIVSAVLVMFVMLTHGQQQSNEIGEDDGLSKPVRNTVHDEYNVYDPTNCRAVGSRILCGYNMNKGQIGTINWWVMPLINSKYGNNCRLRGDRVECGYQGPFPKINYALRSKIIENYKKQILRQKALCQIILVESECVSSEKKGGNNNGGDRRDSDRPVGVGKDGKPVPVGVDGLPIDGNGDNLKPRKRCCPYEFDSNVCKYHDDRILCGYEKNQGKIASATKSVAKGDGCRLRGGRIECGYVEMPFNGIRRPRPWDEFSPDNGVQTNQVDREYVNPSDTTPREDYNVEDAALIGHIRDDIHVSKEDSESPILRDMMGEMHYDAFTRPQTMVTQCVEINGRIVCNAVKGSKLRAMTTAKPNEKPLGSRCSTGNCG